MWPSVDDASGTDRLLLIQMDVVAAETVVQSIKSNHSNLFRSRIARTLGYNSRKNNSKQEQQSGGSSSKDNNQLHTIWAY